jgi:cell wall-associated NlpC family hydrolase
MQEAELGVTLDADASSALRRGDLVYWKGHVGIMQDSTRLIHANAFHMLVASEPLTETIRRIKAGGGEAPRAFKRVTQSA